MYHKLTFRYVHDLDELITGLKEGGIDVPKEVEEAIELSVYAYETRYPGVSEPVTKEEYNRAVELASRVVNWAQTQMNE